MNLRLISLLIATLSVARAGEPATVSKPVQVAEASTAPSARVETVAPAPRAVHGTRRGVLEAADKGPAALPCRPGRPTASR
jgi:hypothetical protein